MKRKKDKHVSYNRVHPFLFQQAAKPAALSFYSREQRAVRTSLLVHMATAASVKYPAVLLRYKLHAP